MKVNRPAVETTLTRGFQLIKFQQFEAVNIYLASLEQLQNTRPGHLHMKNEAYYNGRYCYVLARLQNTRPHNLHTLNNNSVHCSIPRLSKASDICK